MRKQAANDIGLEKVSSSIREMDSRLVKSAREEIAVKESLERRIRHIELSNLGGKVAELDTLAKELLSKSESNEVKLVTDVTQREALEKRVCQMELLNLSEKLAELDTVAKEAARKSDETGAKFAVDAESREDLEKRFHKIELMDLAQKIVEVDSLAEDVMDISRSMQEKLAAEVTQQQQLEGFQRSLDEHLKRIDRHDEQNEDLLEKLAVLTLRSEQKSSELERLESTQSATEKDLDDLRTKVDECAEKLEVLESEADDLSESVTAHSKHVEEQVKGLPVDFRAQLRVLEESFNNTIADLKDVFKCSRAELSAHIAEKAWLSDLQCVRDVVQMWVEEARISHQKSVEALAASMEQVQFSSLQQNIELKKHQEYMKELSKFLKQGLDRDDCVSDVLLHIVEEDYPDLMGVIEKRLRGTSQVPK
jgi:DNA repair exonuclease SbcCD ATPase subunit